MIAGFLQTMTEALGLGIRAPLLAINAVCGLLCFGMTVAAWVRFRSLAIFFMGVHFTGWALSSTTFSIVYFTIGKPTDPVFVIANLASILMICGAFGWCVSLFFKPTPDGRTNQ